MIIIRATSHYLRNQANKYLLLSILSVTAFVIIFFSYLPYPPFTVTLGKYEGVRAAVYVVPLLTSVFFWREYRQYRSGYEGEKTLTKLLKSANLPDDYRLINDLRPSNGYGNIDHVVLSPKGIFAIETKNYKGRITSYGDYWSIRTGRSRGQYSGIGSPSAQSKMNAKTLKRIIESFEPFKSVRIWVEPIVFLSNLEADYTDLAPGESTVEVKKLHELPQFLLEYESNNDFYKTRFSLSEIEHIGKELQKLS